jgi:hypothetical protein
MQESSAIGVGDEVVTIGGIVGRVTALEGDRAWLELDSGIVVEFLRQALSRRVEPSTRPEEPGDDQASRAADGTWVRTDHDGAGTRGSGFSAEDVPEEDEPEADGPEVDDFEEDDFEEDDLEGDDLEGDDFEEDGSDGDELDGDEQADAVEAEGPDEDGDAPVEAGESRDTAVDGSTEPVAGQAGARVDGRDGALGGSTTAAGTRSRGAGRGR